MLWGATEVMLKNDKVFPSYYTWCIAALYSFFIFIKSFYSLWIIGHPWKASRHCGLQLFPLTSFHDLLVFLILSSIVFRHVLFGLPLLLYPWWFQSNEGFTIATVSLRNVRPIEFNFLLFIWFYIDFWWVLLFIRWI